MVKYASGMPAYSIIIRDDACALCETSFANGTLVRALRRRCAHPPRPQLRRRPPTGNPTRAPMTPNRQVISTKAKYTGKRVALRSAAPNLTTNLTHPRPRPRPRVHLKTNLTHPSPPARSEFVLTRTTLLPFAASATATLTPYHDPKPTGAAAAFSSAPRARPPSRRSRAGRSCRRRSRTR